MFFLSQRMYTVNIYIEHPVDRLQGAVVALARGRYDGFTPYIQ